MEVKCKFEYQLWNSIKLYTCVVSSATVTSSKQRIKSFNGIHENEKTNDDVEAVLFANTQVEYFPKGVNVIFPNLTNFSINSCGLKSISRVNLIGLKNIERFYIFSNELTSLPDDLFTEMPKLKVFSFFNNKLECLSSKLLKPILKNDLIWVDFRKNTKLDAIYETGVEGSLMSLKELMNMIDEKCEKPLNNNGKIEFKDKIANGFKEFWMNQKFSDFIVLTRSKEFQVHKFVLAIQSDGFAEMFDSDENASEMKIEDLNAEAVEEFLRFLYTGEISSEVHSFELFALASKLKVHELKSLTEEMILNDLDDTNAYKVFTLGHRYESETIKNAAFEEIRKMFPDKKLADDLVENLDKVKELIEMKLKFDNFFEKFE
jgi:BTB/POZ domain